MKILVNTPSLNLLGGVASHYNGLKSFWTENVKYNTVGRRSSRNHTGVFWLPFDILKFVFRLLTFRPDAVILNPSFDRPAMTRDSIFINITHLLGFKTAVFIHGFDYEYAAEADKDSTARILNRADMLFLLAREFESVLRDWGVKTPVCLTTTKVDDRLLEDYDVGRRSGKVNNILFLSRIEETKGIYIAIAAYNILKKDYPQLTLTVVGDGSELPKVKDFVKNNNIEGINFTGRLSGFELADAFKTADLYLFPTTFGEGMPTSVLEAMAFGLPVITRKVGGVNDFFKNGQMGFVTDSTDSEDFAEAMRCYIESSELTVAVSKFNADYARRNFMASAVALKIEQATKNMINNVL